MKKEMSTIDAFIALRDMGDDDIVIPAKRKRVHEGFSYSVGDPKDMQAAEEKLNEEATKDVALEVIDVDADAVEHLKDNKEYVGQYIIQCNACKRTHFVDGEDLKQAEGNESLYNIDDECPYCHSTDTGYTLVGQVGAVSEEEEAKASNDSLTDEPKFENNEPVESGEEIPEEEAPAEEEPMEEEPEEMSGDETNTSEAEVEDVEDFGSSIDLDDVKADDTEEAPEEEETPVEEAVEELPVEEPKKKRLHLRFKESFANEFKFSAFMDLLVDPEVALQEINVVNKNGQTLFRGSYDELPSEILDGNITSAIFGPKETAGFWTIYVCDQKEADCTVTEVLDILGQPSQVELWDDETLETIFSGSRNDIDPDDLKLGVASIECPRYLTVATNDVVSSEIQEESFDNNSLAARICEANGLKAARIDVAGSEEFYINESIEQLEDLKFTYNHYVKNCNEDIIREYKKVTGYKTLIDEAAEEETLADVLIDDTELTESKGDDEGVAVEQAEELLKNSGAFAVIYGFGSGTAFKAIDPIICKDSDQLKDKTEILTLRYHPTGSIRVVYKHDESLIEDNHECTQCDDTLEFAEHEAEEEARKECEDEECKNCSKVESFKTRKELAIAVAECRNNKQPYSIKRSLKEGYRYDLIKETVDEMTPFDEALDSKKTAYDHIMNTINADDNKKSDVEEGLFDGIKLRKEAKEWIEKKQKGLRSRIINVKNYGDYEKLWNEIAKDSTIDRFQADDKAWNMVTDWQEEMTNLLTKYGRLNKVTEKLEEEEKEICPECGKEICECNRVKEAFDIESLPVDEESFFEESLTEAKKDDELDKVTDSMEKIETVIDLVQDEVEAVDGYTDAIETLDNSKIENKEEIISKLHHIKGEELEHLDELKEVEALMPNVGELAEEPEVVSEPEVEPEEPEQLPELPEEPVEELPADDVAEEGAAVEESLNESDKITDDMFEINPTGELKESIDKPEDVKSCELRKQTLENESEEHLEKLEVVDDEIQKTIKDTKDEITPERKDEVFVESFDEIAFDNVVNEYLDNNYEDTYLFETLSGSIDEDGMIIIEGNLISYSDEEDREIKEAMSFTLTPDSTLTESVNGEKASYKVTDNKTGGVFYY